MICKRTDTGDHRVISMGNDRFPMLQAWRRYRCFHQLEIYRSIIGADVEDIIVVFDVVLYTNRARANESKRIARTIGI
jgi:hypothetical protein